MISLNRKGIQPMKIDPFPMTVGELTKGYKDNGDKGVVAFNGKLEIRPPYQREFIYEIKERKAVIESLRNDFPLGLIYFVDRENGEYEVLDGQQRILSICEYIKGNFSIQHNGKTEYYHTITDKKEKNKVDNYKLLVYTCKGSDDEKLEWFKRINIAGKELYQQEIRNAIYHGNWVTDAKIKFSKIKCDFHKIDGDKYVSGNPKRQDILEKAIKWISDNDIEDYMANHRNQNADEIWIYFNSMIQWIKTTFPKHYNEMKSVDWGPLYNKYKSKPLDPNKLGKEIDSLMEEEDVGKLSGIYPYVLTRDKSYLEIRAFSPKQKRIAYQKQKGICANCDKKFLIEKMEADHTIPFEKKGRTTQDNCQVLCVTCNRRKGAK